MRIIAFCGIDGSGKTTQIIEIKKVIENQGFKVYIAKVPFYPFHKFIDGKSITQYDVRINMAFTFARYYLELLPKLEKEGYDYLLCDRHYLCHLAFALTYGVNDNQIKKLQKIFSLTRDPDYIFYFDIPLYVAMKRINLRRDKPVDSDETSEILGTTLANYKKILSSFAFSNVIQIDATKRSNAITSEIVEKLQIDKKD